MRKAAIPPIVKGSVTSDKFTVCNLLENGTSYDGQLTFTDDSAGNINLIDAGDKVKKFSDIGTVDYAKGIIKIDGVAFKTIVSGSDYVHITVDVDDAIDIKPLAKEVILIQDADITVTMVEDVT